MAQRKIILQPGINAQATQTLNSAGWSASDRIRFNGGYAELIGGISPACNTAVTGTARALHGFSDLNLNNYIAIGTNSRLQLLNSGALYDITPIRRTSNIANAVSTVSGQYVQIADTGSNAAVGDWVNFVIPTAIGGIVLFGYYAVSAAVDTDHYQIIPSPLPSSTVSNAGAVPLFTTAITSNLVRVTLNNHNYVPGNPFAVQVATTVGGITLSGQYIVNTVIDANNFTILAAATATSSASGSENSGQTRIQYLIQSGLASSAYLNGWGAGTWGSGSWGSPSTAVVKESLRQWSLDNFGQILLATVAGGALYSWTPGTLPAPAVLVGTAPSINTAGFVAMPQQQMILLGASVGGVQDPLLVAFSDVGDYTSWTPSPTNQAGSFRLSNASKIVGGRQAPQAALIWTDVDLWAMTYSQPPFIYSFSVLGHGCGLLAMKAHSTLGRNTYWLSDRGIFTFGDGGVQQLTCPVWDILFNNLDTNNSDKCFVASNSEFGEVWFFFPSLSGGTGEIDSYIKYNVNLGLWDYGSLVRTAWVDSNPLGKPVSVDGPGMLQRQEVGYSGYGTAPYIESGYADLVEGTEFLFIDQIIPDIFFNGPNPSVSLTVYATNFPGDAPAVFGPYTVTPSTEYISLRVRARQLAFKIQSRDGASLWRIGAIRYRGAGAGRQ